MEEDSCDLEYSSEESDVLSHDSEPEENVSKSKKANRSSQDNAQYRRDRYGHIHLPTSTRSYKEDLRAGSYRRRNPHTHRTRCFVHQQGDPYHSQGDSSVSVDEVLNLLPTYKRKTRQQCQQEKEAAITIQSAWRGHQVRRHIDTMNEAATKIQAAFRGHVTRKELPLELSGYARTDRPKIQRKARTDNQSKCCPELLNCLQKFGLVSGPHTQRQNIVLPKARPSRCPKYIIEDYPVLNPNVSFFEIKSPLRPNREVFTYKSLNVFAQTQRYQAAATTIQAAWRGYQIRQKIPINLTIRKTSWKHTLSGHTLEAHEIHQIFTRPVLRKAPRIRNINIRTVVKNAPASSQKPNISIQVLSPRGVIQGFQRDMSRGAQALYTVASKNATIPSQIFIHVTLQKGSPPKN
ncbi:abnormal spindle-like microcephaly-associated protein homolog [Anolis carolinensis]|uniref:abnormal spindle-like microcephaly-associated protein homolog n=1 Tax=Anolis carolinensis TaxID=28377 RepID=UPI002F2B168C